MNTALLGFGDRDIELGDELLNRLEASLVGLDDDEQLA